ncbi:hypothetical protein SCUCBS95973_005593 [Sporothrix curviconia]|uniref:Uncharacterized protein n=1 Tax=Sporothrix curviconia TaxID=1260050 RepID=A0ABP0C0B9_9PEZI
MKVDSGLAAAQLLSVAAAFGAHNEPPKGVVGPTENFLWAEPFHDHRLVNKLQPACSIERTFAAHEFQLHDLYEHAPAGLWAFGDALKTIFSGRPYPGGWDGLDPHMYERPLLYMNYTDMPVAVREWIEEGERTPEDADDGEQSEDDKKTRAARKNLFAVFERPTEPLAKVAKTVTPPKTAAKAALLRPLDAKRVVIFAPGALYGTLPLWVAEAAGAAGAAESKADGSGSGNGSRCDGKVLRNLGLYAPKPKDGGVIAWVTEHTEPARSKGERAMTFTVKVQTLQAAGAAKIGGDGRDEL